MIEIEVTYEVVKRTNEHFFVTEKQYEEIAEGGDLPEEIQRELEHNIDTGYCDREDDYTVVNSETDMWIKDWR